MQEVSLDLLTKYNVPIPRYTSYPTVPYWDENIDQIMRQYILDVACRGKAHFAKKDLELLRQYTFDELDELALDDLVSWGEHGLIVTDLGKHFIRNICKAFDLKLLSAEVQKKTFSQAV